MFVFSFINNLCKGMEIHSLKAHLAQLECKVKAANKLAEELEVLPYEKRKEFLKRMQQENADFKAIWSDVMIATGEVWYKKNKELLDSLYKT